MKPYDWQVRLLEKLRNRRTDGQLYLNSVVVSTDHLTRLYFQDIYRNIGYIYPEGAWLT